MDVLQGTFWSLFLLNRWVPLWEAQSSSKSFDVVVWFRLKCECKKVMVVNLVFATFRPEA